MSNANSKQNVRRSYPKAEGTRSGCKVSWLYYSNEADAREAAEAAKVNARLDEAMGYDFGFQSPGTYFQVGAVPLTGEYAKFNGMWEVCIP